MLERVTKVSLKASPGVQQIVYKWRNVSTVATLPRSGCPAKTIAAQRRMLNEVKKDPSVSAKDLQKSLEDANISVNESTIRKTLSIKKHCCTSEVSKRAPTDKIFTAHQHQNFIPTVNYGGGSIMVWGCFAASEPDSLLSSKEK
jgi:hypothetical protein